MRGGRKAVSPLLATIILIAIVVSAGLVFYGLMSGLFGALAPSRSFEVVSVDLVKASTGGLFSMTVKNTGSMTASLVRVSINTDGGTVEYVAGSTKSFYLICVEGVSGSWVDPPTFYQGCMDALSQASDITLTRISTLSDLDNLVRNPPEGAVVINCHGELVPRPATWPNWQSYFLAIAENVKDKGWIFATANGYPLYYTQLEAVGTAGLNAFLSSVGASADAQGRTAHTPTPEGAEALSKFGITAANPLSGVRTVAWYGIAPSYRFYAESGGRDLAAAVKMGGGFYLNAETSQLSDRDGGRYAAAFAYWLSSTAQLQPGRTASLTVAGLQVTAGEKYALTVTVKWADGSTASKSLTVQCMP